jgi:hypothetical protein
MLFGGTEARPGFDREFAVRQRQARGAMRHPRDLAGP